MATPCPLLIAIPVAVIGSISLSARLGIIIKNPAILETIDNCTTVIFDKTGTLTYGRPQLTEDLVADELDPDTILKLVASLERYSKHPLAGAVIAAAKERGIQLDDASSLSERPGEGLRGEVDGHEIRVISRKQLAAEYPEEVSALPAIGGGLECVIVLDNRYAATYRFRDEPRQEGASFIQHLRPKHAFARVMLVSGDRESEVRYLADQVGIEEVYFNQSPEQKLELVRIETTKAPTCLLYTSPSPRD